MRGDEVLFWLTCRMLLSTVAVWGSSPNSSAHTTGKKPLCPLRFPTMAFLSVLYTASEGDVLTAARPAELRSRRLTLGLNELGLSLLSLLLSFSLAVTLAGALEEARQ